MYLAYVDESGDKGPIANGGSRTYTLGCVLVSAQRWALTFDQLIRYRRYLKLRFGVPVRAELKANHLLRNGGDYFRKHPLPLGMRAAIYKSAMRLQPKLEMTAFAVVIWKAKLYPHLDPHEWAWKYLLQRLERFTEDKKQPVLIMHDEGDALSVRKMARKARRAGIAGSAFGTGLIQVPARLIVDDPVSRQSDQSYFLQLADLNAYAAYRAHFPPPTGKPSIVPSTTWNQLGVARLDAANQLMGGVPGIVFWPR